MKIEINLTKTQLKIIGEHFPKLIASDDKDNLTLDVAQLIDFLTIENEDTAQLWILQAINNRDLAKDNTILTLQHKVNDLESEIKDLHIESCLAKEHANRLMIANRRSGR